MDRGTATTSTAWSRPSSWRTSRSTSRRRRIRAATAWAPRWSRRCSSTTRSSSGTWATAASTGGATGAFEQLTEDHSLLNDYIKMKHLSPDEIAAFPHKNVIVRALGMKDTVQVDVHVDAPRMGDVYVLCSDGLSGMVKDEEIAEIVATRERDLDVVCERLISTANKNGGLDNITVVAIRIEARLSA